MIWKVKPTERPQEGEIVKDLVFAWSKIRTEEGYWVRWETVERSRKWGRPLPSIRPNEYDWLGEYGEKFHLTEAQRMRLGLKW